MIIFLYVILSLSFSSIMYQGVRPIHGTIIQKDHFLKNHWTLLQGSFQTEEYGIRVEEEKPSVSHWLQPRINKFCGKEQWDKLYEGEKVRGNRMFGFKSDHKEAP